MERKYVEAVVRVGAEFLLPDQRLKITVRRGDQPHIGVQRTSRAETVKLVLLQHAEQLWLQFERQFADLVQDIVPWLASSKRPIRLEIAPVKAPRLCPNNSLSSRPLGIAGAIDLHEELRSCTARPGLFRV